MYEKSCELIYNLISSRIKKRRYDLKRTNNDIYEDDVNLVSAIANNPRHPKKNPYLLPNGNSKDSAINEQSNKIKIIAENLSFSSEIELIIGTTDELNNYSGCLFYHLIIDALESKVENTKSTLETLLLDYIPYAEASFFCSAFNEVSLIPTALQVYYADIDDLFTERDYAIARLYQLHADEFKNDFTDIFVKDKNTTKLNKRLSNFVSKKLVPKMANNRASYLLSANVNTMLYNTHKLSVEEIEHNLMISTVYAPDSHEYNDDEINVFGDEFTAANIAYVDSLRKIQEKIEGIPDLSLLMNKS